MGSHQSSDRAGSHGARAIALHAWLLAAVAGGAYGLAAARREIDVHGYDVHGLWRTAAELATTRATCGATFGVLFGAALVAISAFAWVAAARADRRLDTLARAAFSGLSELSALLVPLIGAIGSIAVMLATAGSIRPRDGALALALIALAWVRHAVLAEVGANSARARIAAALWPPLVLAMLSQRHRFIGWSGSDGDTAYATGWIALALAAIVFVWPALFVLRLAPARRAWHHALPVLAAAACAVLVARAASFGDRSTIPSVAGSKAPANVLILGIDTLRADHVSLPGSPATRELTPNLRRLADRGATFTRAISQAPWTMPAFGSIFTGKYPHEHGAISKKGELRDRELTLAEVLREAGFDTASIVSHYFVNNTHGFGQGYRHFDRAMVLGEMAITSDGLVDRSIGWLEARDRSAPFFLFTHFFDPHYEYRDHEQVDFADGYRGWLREELQIQNVRHKRSWLTEAERRWIVDLYDEEIVHTDREIGRLLDYLEHTGLDRDTWILLVADHGEEFFERGWLGHSITLNDEVLRVPLVIAPPRGLGAARRVDRLVETRAVFQTVLDCVGVPLEGSTRPSLAADVTGAAAGDANASFDANARAFSSVWTPDANPDTGLQARIFSLRTERWTLIWDEARERRWLFDARDDPRELVDLAAGAEAPLATLRAELEAWVASQKAALPKIPYREIHGAEAERLRALGYL